MTSYFYRMGTVISSLRAGPSPLSKLGIDPVRRAGFTEMIQISFMSTSSSIAFVVDTDFL